MTGRVIRFPIADPLETALVAATELDREQLEQLQEQVAALLAALPPPCSCTSRESEAGAFPVYRRPAGGSARWRLD
jgi:hypothetical protein